MPGQDLVVLNIHADLHVVFFEKNTPERVTEVLLDAVVWFARPYQLTNPIGVIRHVHPETHAHGRVSG